MSVTDFATRLARPEYAMADDNDDTLPVGPPRRRESDRSPFSDPRFVLQIIALLVSVAGGMVISWTATQSRATALESAAANLKETAQEIKGQLNTITASMQTISTTNSTLRVEVDSLKRELQDMREQRRMDEARIISLERGLARQEARQ